MSEGVGDMLPRVLAGGFGLGLYGWLVGWRVDELVNKVAVPAVFFLFEVLLVGLGFGVITDELPTRTIPNEGILRSLKNALVTGTGFGLGVWLGVGLFVGLVEGLVDGLVAGLVVGLIVGLIVGMRKGGSACIRHGVLRLFLLGYAYAPRNYVRFLEHAKDLLFLRRVGGGYIFVHRMLMEHFAGMEGKVAAEGDS